MRISTIQLFNQSLTAMQNKQSELSRIQLQISSGKRLDAPSTDPIAAARVVELQQSSAATRQYQRNGDVVNSRLIQEEGALMGVETSVQRIRVLTIQANSTALSRDDRGMIALEIKQRLADIVDRSNTTDPNGDYIFSGFQSRTQPFIRDAATGQMQYNGDQGVRSLQVGADRRIADGDPGSDVFMAIRNGNGTFVTDPAGANTGTGIISPGTVADTAAYQAQSFTIVFNTPPDTFDVLDSTATVLPSMDDVAYTGRRGDQFQRAYREHYRYTGGGGYLQRGSERQPVFV